jgi:YidC/Oxa1 family membrane protein insertase
MVIAIVLSIAILIGYQFFIEKMGGSPPKSTPVKEQPKEEAKPAAGTPAPILPKTAPSGPEREIVVENEVFKAVLTSKGGTLKRVELKAYKDKAGKPIVLKGDDLVPPFALGLDDSFQLGQVGFVTNNSDVRLTPQSPEATVIFQYSSGEKSLRRSYRFTRDDYAIALKDEVSGVDAYWITLGKDFGIHERDDSVHFGPVILQDADRLEYEPKKMKEPKVFLERVKWIAQEDKYFFSSLVPKGAIQEAKVWGTDGASLVALKTAGGTNEYLAYAGPKEYDRLKNLGYGLEHIVDFGFFSILARPLFWVLKFFYGLVHNYGIAIIILTFLVRIPFIPIVNKGQKSMKKLQDIQPRMAEIREKYKKDPQKMQQELMELYKKHKVNPMGGCLPIVLQIPVFFALYKVLLIAIELRGAPFAFWIDDLSAKDPYYILPIIMGVTMVIQQKMTPSTMDPRQQKLMMLMPIFFTFLFLNFPSGLVLYWLANNVLSIGQQFYVNQKAEKNPA